MKSAIEAIREVQDSAKVMPQIRVVSEMKIGQVARQGDIYVERVKAASKGREIASRQLAPGETKGSRHIVADSSEVRIYESAAPLGRRRDYQRGPAIEARGDLCIQHPEHAWIRLPAGDYQVWYQNDWVREQRVRD